MKKTALVFLLAIFVPALILGGLALRTAGKQRMIIEQQEIALRQGETDRVAGQIRQVLEAQQQEFARVVNALVTRDGERETAADFATRLRSEWPRAALGFAVTTSGQIISPTRGTSEERAQAFLRENSLFLGNKEEAEVYQAQSDASAVMQNLTPQTEEAKEQSLDLAKARGRGGAGAPAGFGRAKSEPAELASAPAESNRSQGQQQFRKIAPQRRSEQQPPQQLASNLFVANSRFNQLVAGASEGTIARFVQDELEVIFWTRPTIYAGKTSRTSETVFGAQLDLASLRELIAPSVQNEEYPSSSSSSLSLKRRATTPEICLAVLDDHAKPVVRSLPDFTANWRTPFVATEIGEVLPHWEAALYLTDPDRLARTAQLFNYLLYALIALALAAMAVGSYLVVADTRRQLALVQKKTDFVSNVSHELKTPLTSIRMFAELLHEGRVREPEKMSRYLRIITLEAERLTRLINNVLDFARLERGQKRYDKRALDLHGVLARLWEGQEMHLREQDFTTSWQAGAPPYRVFGDEDALAQVVVNLLSNAEKYSGSAKSIELHSYVHAGRVCVSVLDRGTGVPPGEEQKIFEHFYRAHDSLSNGIQGSGLGLTLAKKIAEDHGGTIRYSARKDGGSNFTLELPEAGE